MIPYIESVYRINYAHVSVLFVSTFLGYVVAAVGAGPLSRRIGFGHALCMSAMIELAGVCRGNTFFLWSDSYDKADRTDS